VLDVLLCAAPLAGPSYSTRRASAPVDMRKHRTEVVALLGDVIAPPPMSEWSERFDRRAFGVGAPAIRCPSAQQTVADVLESKMLDLAGALIRATRLQFSECVPGPSGLGR
jgi:hypothetical protein